MAGNVLPPAIGSRPKVRRRWGEALLLLGPGGFWLTAFFLIPILLILFRSWIPLDGVGFTLENYARVFEQSGRTPIYLNVIGRSLFYAAVTTIACLGLGLPVAYWLAILSPKRWRNLLLLLFVLPLWTSSLLRAYAWITILRPTGVLNSLLTALGLPRLLLLNRTEGVILGMTCAYLPYMVLVLYSSLEKLDLRLLEAAADLGANAWQTFYRVTVPQVAPGMVAGCVLVSITSFGDFISPQLLGGPSNRAIASLIELQFLGAARNWGFGSALSVVLIAGIGLALALLLKYGDRRAIDV